MLLTLKMHMIQKIMKLTISFSKSNAAGKLHITEQNTCSATSGLEFYKDNSLCGTPLLGSTQETNCPLVIRLVFASFTYCYASYVLGQMCKDKLSKTASEIPSAPLHIPSFVYTLSLAASNKRPNLGLVYTSKAREIEISTFKVEAKSLQLHICKRRDWNFPMKGFQ